MRGEVRQTFLMVQDIHQRLAGPPQPPAAGAETLFPAGHFYSPIADTAEVRRRQARFFDRTRDPVGIDLNGAGQISMLHRLARHYGRLPFAPEKRDGIRYRYENPAFSYGDAIVLACLLLELRPKRVIEVGSGFSSCVTLDVNELFLDNTLDVTFVEPYPDLLLSLMKAGDAGRCSVIHSPVQDIDLSIVDALEDGDILFIDSTHVSKCGSDVNFELFEILPRLRKGVYIHFHDVFFPFEYPEEWVLGENRSWNELYILRAFLTNNPAYDIVYFNHYMYLRHRELVEQALPLAARNCGGGLWLRKR